IGVAESTGLVYVLWEASDVASHQQLTSVELIPGPSAHYEGSNRRLLGGLLARQTNSETADSSWLRRPSIPLILCCSATARLSLECAICSALATGSAIPNRTACSSLE